MTVDSRRSFLRTATVVCGGALVAACSSPGTSAPAESSPANPAPSSLPGPGRVASPSLASQPPTGVAPQPSAAAAGPLVAASAAWVSLVADMLVFPLAFEAGFFQKYGLDFDLSYVNGSNNGLAGMLSHSLDMITAGGAVVVSARATGQDVVLVMGFVNRSIFRVIAAPEIATMADLKGKTVAVSKVGSGTDYFYWQTIAAQQGWGPNDLQYVGSTDSPGEMAMVEQGAAQAFATIPPGDLVAQQFGGHVIFDAAQQNLPEQQVGLLVSRDYLGAHRDVLLNVARASVEAIHRWKTDAAFTESVFEKYLKSSDPAINEAGWASLKDVLPEQPFPSREGILSVFPSVVAQNPAAAQVQVEATYDASIVQELVDSGFIQQIYGA